METNGGFAPKTGESLKDRLSRVRSRIETAALDCGRQQEDVRLVAVSKTVPVETLLRAIDLGITVFGENYVHATFPSVSAAWTITNEGFMADRPDWMVLMK